MTARLPKRTRVIVEIRGGVVEEITADRPIDILTINHDEDILETKLPVCWIAHREAFAAISDGVTVNRKLVGEIFRALKGGA